VAIHHQPLQARVVQVHRIQSPEHRSLIQAVVAVVQTQETRLEPVETAEVELVQP
jgi:hypothetical protein